MTLGRPRRTIRVRASRMLGVRPCLPNTLRTHVRSHRDRREAVPRRGRHGARGRADRRQARRRRSRWIASCSSPTVTGRDRPPGRDRGQRQRRGPAPGARREGHRLQVPPKARRRVKKGHRQELTVLRIADIVLGGKSAAAAVKEGRGGREDRASAPGGGRAKPGRRGRRTGRQAARRRRPRSPPPRRADEPKTTAKSAPKPRQDGSREARGQGQDDHDPRRQEHAGSQGRCPEEPAAKPAPAPKPRATKKDE